MTKKQIKFLIKHPNLLIMDPDFGNGKVIFLMLLLIQILFATILFILSVFIENENARIFLIPFGAAFSLTFLITFFKSYSEKILKKSKEIIFKEFAIDLETIKLVSKKYKKVKDLYVAATSVFKGKTDLEIVEKFPIVIIDMRKDEISLEIKRVIKSSSRLYESLGDFLYE